MAGTAKVGGGLNPMHLTNTKDGDRQIGTTGSGDGMSVKGSGGRSYVRFAHTVGVGANPGGDGDKISANASMRKKRPMQGPGDAR